MTSDIIYYQKCKMSSKIETFIKNIFADNVVWFKCGINLHKSGCRTVVTTCKFPIPAYKCLVKEEIFEFEIIVVLTLHQ